MTRTVLPEVVGGRVEALPDLTRVLPGTSGALNPVRPFPSQVLNAYAAPKRTMTEARRAGRRRS